MFLLLVLLLIISAILTSWFYFWSDRKKFSVSGPTPIPILGNAYSFIGKPSGDYC